MTRTGAPRIQNGKAHAVLLGGAAVFTAMALTTVIVRKRRRRLGGRNHALPPRRPPTGMATHFTLVSIDRTEDGRVGGLSATKEVQDLGSDDIPFQELMDHTPRLALYCLDVPEQLLVFFQLQEGSDLIAEPFFDRGVRKFAGENMYITSWTTAAQYLQAHPHVVPDSSRITWVWNTGRCGSTLLHRMMIKAGVCSLSEPYWFEEMCRLRCSNPSIEEHQLLTLCLSLDVHLTKRSYFPNATHVGLDPKAMGHRLLDLAIKEMPDSRHIFMYRDCTAVVESFQSIFYYEAPWWYRPYLLLFGLGPVTRQDFINPTLRSRFEHGRLPVPWKRMAAKNAVMWLDAVFTWLQLKECLREDQQVVLRMDEFVNASLRARVVFYLLRFILQEEPSPQLVNKCFSVFGKHSQLGDRMMRSSSHTQKVAFLTKWDQEQIVQLVSSQPEMEQFAVNGCLHSSIFTARISDSEVVVEDEKRGGGKGAGQ